MTLRALSLRAAGVVAVLALLVPGGGLAAEGEVTTVRGIVQSAGAGQIVLRALDGSVVTFGVTLDTRVKLNGERASLASVRPGFVAAVTHDGRGSTLVIRAFGRLPTVVDRGVVIALTRTAITLRVADASALTIAIDAATRFRLQGTAARRLVARPGAAVAVTHLPHGPATIVNVLERVRG